MLFTVTGDIFFEHQIHYLKRYPLYFLTHCRDEGADPSIFHLKVSGTVPIKLLFFLQIVC